MAKGAEAKAKVFKQILEAFPGSFAYNDGKEIRIPMADVKNYIAEKLQF